MPTIMRFTGLSKAYGTQSVLVDIKGEINSPCVIGLIGDNGCGKSTLLRILAKQELPDSGEIKTLTPEITVAYLPQELPTSPGLSVRAYVQQGLTQLVKLQQTLQELEQSMADCTSGRLQAQLERYGHLQLEFARLGGYHLPVRVEKALRDVGLPEHLWELSLDALSGGQKTRLALARALITQPALLLLDEPTNYLDLTGLAWLEEWISNSQLALLLVSHDRYFLDQVTTEIWELERGEIQVYKGNYSAYKAQKKQAMQKQYAAYAQEQAEKRRLRELIAKQSQWFQAAHQSAGQNDYLRARAKKNAARAKATISRLERLLEQEVEKPWEKNEIGIEFQSPTHNSQNLLSAESLSFGYDEELLLRGINFQLRPGERVAIIGANGSGKTTFLRLLLGELTPVAGRLYRSPTCTIGHFSQERDDLHPENSLLAELETTGISRSEAWLLLARLGFRDQTVLRPIKTLSVGQRARVSLAKLLVSPLNVLVLDEPTNHLDINSREKIEAALQDYPGALILVAHDRYFLDASVNQVYHLQNGQLTRYLGNYSYFVQAQSSDQKEEQLQVQETVLRTRLAALAARLSSLSSDSTEYAELDQEFKITVARLRCLLSSKQRQ